MQTILLPTPTKGTPDSQMLSIEVDVYFLKSHASDAEGIVKNIHF